MAGKGGARPGAGRKKGYKAIAAEKAREYLVRRIAEELEPITDVILASAKAGDTKSLEYLINQLIGKPKETLEVQEDVVLKIDV